MICEHCGAVDKDSWPTLCRWSQLSEKNHIAVALMGLDPPCSIDELIAKQKATERTLSFWLCCFGVTAFIATMALFASHWK